ncbi:unnamed protein product [Protopolystoma xenopodis]|uniref:Uncharacterized protein n=1 Tax=Protopolystoma xenopodis TaxID=117903 RepID=A0A3S5FDP4_9PLAT|nr:unnamed protein product [Protopolystoma xenopodis]
MVCSSQILPHLEVSGGRDTFSDSLESAAAFRSRLLKPLTAALDMLRIGLSGGLVNFGVFSLFGDTSLEKSVEMGVRLIMGIQYPDLVVI